MEPTRKRQVQVLLVLSTVSIFLLVLVVLLMRHVQELLISDLRISLVEVVTQNRDAIASQLQLKFQDVEHEANQFAGHVKRRFPDHDSTAIREYIADYGAANNNGRQFIANELGVAKLKDGRVINIAGRRYFRQAAAGELNVSEKLVSRYDGENIFVISAPVRVDGVLIATYQYALAYEDLRKILSVPLFSSSGYSHIIDSEGYLVVGKWQQSDNYFRELYAQGNAEAMNQLEADMRAGRSGLLASRMADQTVFSSYTPIDNAKGWYLIVSVPVAAVLPNGGMIVNLFYAILLLVVLASAAGLGYFFWYKNRQQVRLSNIAFVDPVTQGDTYAKFLEDAQKLLMEQPQTAYAIVKADVDNFKYINKFYGFEAGNQVLRQIHGHIQRQLTAVECMTRITGDNFVLLLDDSGLDRLNLLFEPREHQDMMIYFSVGIYTIEKRDEDISIMIDKAGIAVKTIKGSVHEFFSYYTQELEAVSVHNETLKHRIRKGLRQDEFVPFYQPKVDVATRRVVGCEALARWRTGDGSFVSPAEFIPISEQTGMVLELDMVIYEKALAFLRRCLDEGQPCVPVSVNFSKEHLLDRNFVGKIKARAERFGIPSSLIEIELTESTFFENFEAMVAFSRQLQAHGFLVAMDDFGSGYSSLNMLKTMPIDVLKIDKCFLDQNSDRFKRDVIFEGVANIARKLGLRVVVEGVETLDDVNLMKQCECSVAQGYHFSRPVPQEEFIAFVREHGAGVAESRLATAGN
ncbi:bifunctional diguanylate cyclase/phosphodiesterase [Achromobacter denitrificans]